MIGSYRRMMTHLLTDESKLVVSVLVRLSENRIKWFLQSLRGVCQGCDGEYGGQRKPITRVVMLRGRFEQVVFLHDFAGSLEGAGGLAELHRQRHLGQILLDEFADDFPYRHLKIHRM